MTFKLATVTNSIAALSVTGLTIKDVDEIPARVYGRECPILYPEPLEFVTAFEAEKMTFSRGVTVKWRMRYNLTYTLMYAAIGSGRGLEKFAETIAMACLFFDVLMESHPITGAALVVPVSIGVPGIMYDVTGPGAPNAETFYGTRLTIQVQENNG
ncbi:MAG: hypothetical protein WC710_14290 [Gallionella sp.]|jgi:hypothetical protein